MHNIYNIISDIDILNNETKRMNCPECGGYKTFTISNNMGRLLWNCYKASCSISGSKPVHLSVEDIKRTIQKEEKKAEDFGMPEFVVPYNGQKDLLRFAESYKISVNDMEYDVKDNRAVFPVIHGGYVVDAIGRSSYNGVDLFEGTTPMSKANSPRGENSSHGALSNMEPGDAGVDISGLMGNAATWKTLAKG